MYSICNVHVRKNVLTLKWYTDRKFFGDGGGRGCWSPKIYYIVGGGGGYYFLEFM